MTVIDESVLLCSVDEADSYLASRLFTEDWFASNRDDKVKALLMSTNAITRLSFTDLSTTCPNKTIKFPNYGQTEPLDQIKQACAENALTLIQGVDPEREQAGLRVTSRRYSSVGTTYDAARPPQHIVNGIMSITAWGLLRPFLADVGSVRLHRVS